MTRHWITDRPRLPAYVVVETALLALLKTGPATARELRAALPGETQTPERVHHCIRHLLIMGAIKHDGTRLEDTVNCTGKVRAAVYAFVKDVDTSMRRWGGGVVKKRKPAREPPPEASDRRSRAPRHSRRNEAGAGARGRVQAAGRRACADRAQARLDARRPAAVHQYGPRRSHQSALRARAD